MRQELIEFMHSGKTLQDLLIQPVDRSITVAVIDSGIDATHPELVGKVSKTVAFDKNNDQITLANLHAGPNDVCGHGTACAGIINQVCPTANYLDVRVLNSLNIGSGDVLLKGLEFAIEEHVPILNMSLGTKRSQFILPMLGLIQKAFMKNIIIVAAADNFGDMIYPSSFPSLVTVDIGEGRSLQEISRRADSLIQYGGYGDGIRTCDLTHGHTTMTGTSFATPHITGIIARILCNWPGLLVEEIKVLLDYFANKNQARTNPA